MRNKYTDKQIEVLRKYYPLGDWDSILPFFPNTPKINIRATARRYGLHIANKGNQIINLDITGKKYNMLTALSVDHEKGKFQFWKCLCECGNETIVDKYSLIKGSTKSCGCLKHKTAYNAKDYTNQKFGMLTAVERLPNYKNKTTYYRCLCDCGNEITASISNLRTGHITTCGCHKLKRKEFWELKHPMDDDKRTYCVYRHIAPNGKCYIGITKQEPERRFQNGMGYKTQEVFWRAINKYGWDSFKHEILESGLTEKRASELEDHYIKNVYHSFAPNGYNTAEGGIKGKNLTKPIIQYYNNEPVNFFEGISYASKCLGIAQQTIRSHIGKNNAVGGYHFEQMNPIHTYDIPQEYWELNSEEHYNIQTVVAKELHETTIARNLKGSKAINKYDLEGHYICTFPSIAEACASISTGKGDAIRAVVNPNRQGDSAYGFMWKYDDGNHEDIHPIKYKMKKSVLQINPDTGDVIQEYESISKAAKALHTGINQISEACKGVRKTWHGYIWKYKTI